MTNDETDRELDARLDAELAGKRPEWPAARLLSNTATSTRSERVAAFEQAEEARDDS